MVLQAEESVIFAARQVEYLGHISSQMAHIAIDPSKIKAILDWPVPMKNVQVKLQSYLGCKWLFSQIHPQHYSLLKARPLSHALTRKDAKFVWTDEHHTNAVRANSMNAIVHPTMPCSVSILRVKRF